MADALEEEIETPATLNSTEGPAEKEFPYFLNHDIFGPHRNGRAAATAIVSDKYRLAYVPIPKNACSSLKLTMRAIIGEQKVKANFRRIHQIFGYPAIDFKRFAQDKDHFKFIVIRDPIERFISAFNNRVIMHDELTESWVRQHQPQQVAGFAKRSLSYSPDINEFARRLKDYIAVSLQIRHHFIGQRRFFHNRPQAFDKIYTIRQLPELAAELSERVGYEVAIPRAQESRGIHNEATVKDLGSRELSLVVQYYVEDYLTLRPYLN